ncbi:quino protein amine dehydrogenase beta chain-like protein [Viridothelium virens]|uniref:Quino protein amine dehydrogenase beta chain-like protein n=1 Tax=Viridothelium virens TaxID=1048519 RepID=A0A6A6HGQ8_VIRVR|nr:quino protein amine dehydrogenase beta chain-like protein [Viridothelium virens]
MFLRWVLNLVSLISSILSCSASPVKTQTKNNPVVIHQFPVGAWCENLAPTWDGKILVTRADVPELYLIDPSQPPSNNAKLIATIPDSNALSGIVEVFPNVFAFAAGNISLTTGTSTPGSFSIWRADLRTSTTTVSKIADVHQTAFVNGLTLLPAQAGMILLADSSFGAIWRFDTRTGTLELALNNTALAAPSGALGPGVNGIRVQDGYLYYTNTAAEKFGRVPIDPNIGAATGAFTTLASNITNDDFALDQRAAYLASVETEEIILVNLVEHDAVSVFAGNPNSTEVAGPTSVRFGVTPKTKDTIFVTTNGGRPVPVSGTTVIGGELLAFKL